MIATISGGVTTAKGFRAAGIHCRIRKNREKPDLAMIAAETMRGGGGLYPEPGQGCADHGHAGKPHGARAVICNSGNANTCNADGEEKARRMCSELAAGALGIGPGGGHRGFDGRDRPGAAD